MAGEIISERRARSNRNGGRHHRGFAGDFPRNPHVTPEFAGSVADSLLTALQLARPIVADEDISVGKPQFTAWVQSVVVVQIDDCLASAKETFPDAESFQLPPEQ
jgi:hypothetical protein